MKNPIRQYPAVAAGVVTGLLAVLLVYGLVDEKEAAAWEAFALALLPLVQAFVTRAFVMPVETVKEAGLDPEQVKRDAADPDILPFKEGA